MKRIGITQRVVYVERINERRDVLDQRWYDFADALGVILIPIPNNLKNPSLYVEELEFDGLIFSGGNNIGFRRKEIIDGKSIEKDDVAYERDNTEMTLIDWCVINKIPIIGVCRGMQALNVYYGGSLTKVDEKLHVAQLHPLEFTNGKLKELFSKESIVNSFHNWGVTREGLAEQLAPLATFNKTEIEAFVHKTLPFTGIMWHPERYSNFRNSDISFFKEVLRIN